MLLKLLPRFRNIFSLASQYSTTASFPIPDLIVDNKHEDIRKIFASKYKTPRQIWLENVDTIDEKKVGLLQLHPEIFAANPRIDIIHQNVKWQQLYRYVSWAHTKSRFECRGGGKKPWRQKGKGVY